MVCSNLLDDTVLVQAAEITFNVGNDLLLSFLFEDNLAAERCILKAFLHLGKDVARVASDKRFKTFLITKLCTRMTYEVKNSQVVFVFM